jgi:antirestriction protein ArdC
MCRTASVRLRILQGLRIASDERYHGGWRSWLLFPMGKWTASHPPPTALPEHPGAPRTRRIIPVPPGRAVSHGGSRAYYSPANDTIQMPAARRVSAARGPTTAFWRTKRFTRPATRRGCTVSTTTTFSRSRRGTRGRDRHRVRPRGAWDQPGAARRTSPTANWLAALKNDNRCISTAANAAQKAVGSLD